MNDKQIRKTSKFLSLVLRHRPEKLDLDMDNQGWVSVEELLGKMSIGMGELEEVVETNDKKRFAFNEDKTRIRASQGHSVKLDLGYTPTPPPDQLYHGTATRFLDSIRKTGLDKRNRHHVHLSPELSTATNVGSRHGKVVVLVVQAGEMHKAGHEFFLSQNGVWLTETVPVEFIIF